MGDVIGFPMQNRGRPERDGHYEKEQRAARADALRKEIALNRKMTREDQQLVAESLWLILGRAEKKSGVRKAAMLLHAGIGVEGDSTKHLSQYAIPPEWPSERKDAARLNKTPQKYAAIASSCASIAGMDCDETIIELFSRSSLARRGDPKGAAPEYERLARSLRDIARAVAAKHGLQEYFRTVLRAKASLGVDEDSAERADAGEKLDPSEIDLEFHSLDTWIDWPVDFYRPSYDARNFDNAGCVPLYPTIVLGQFTPGDRFDDKFDDSCDWDPHDTFELTVDIGSASLPGVPPFPKTVFSVPHSYSTEIRLCIVPVGPEMWPEVAFRVVSKSKRLRFSTQHYFPNSHRVVELEFPDFYFIHFPPGQTYTIDAKVRGTNETIKCDFKCEAGYTFRLLESILPESVAPDINDNGCTFLPVTGTICEKLLGADWSDDCWDAGPRQAHTRVLGPAVANNRSSSGFLDFPVGTIAANLDDLLSSESRLNPLTMLDRRAQRLVELLADAVKEDRDTSEAGHARLNDRIRSMLGDAG